MFCNRRQTNVIREGMSFQWEAKFQILSKDMKTNNFLQCIPNCCGNS